MQLPPPQAAALGAALGLAIALFAVGAEVWLSGVGWSTLHTTSVTVWVVESLPLMLGVAGYGVADRRRPAPKASPAVAARPVQVAPAKATPPPAPTYPTPAPVPRTPTERPSPPRQSAPSPAPIILPTSLAGQALLYVDRHAESPSVVQALEEVGLRVVHVRDAMSGAVAWEAEGPTLAAIDTSDPHAAALVQELRSDGAPLVSFGPGTDLPRPLRPQALVDALASIL